MQMETEQKFDFCWGVSYANSEEHKGKLNTNWRTYYDLPRKTLVELRHSHGNYPILKHFKSQ